MVKFLPEGDRYSMKFKEFTSQLAVAMGGRVAEEITFGKENITSGATGDIQQATKMAKAMVTQMGYSEELGLVAYGEVGEEFDPQVHEALMEMPYEGEVTVPTISAVMQRGVRLNDRILRPARVGVANPD